jgi:hypothetical protein
MLDVIVLVLLLVTAAAGIVALLSWLAGRRRVRAAGRTGRPFPTTTVVVHLLGALLTLALWGFYLDDGRVRWAWVALVVVLVTNGLGDMILAGRWREGAGMAGRWLSDWIQAVRQILRGTRLAGTLHAALAGTTTALMLVACIVASVS